MIDPRILELDIGFLLDREIAPLRFSPDRLALGMRDVSDREAIAAMRFATGLAVDPVPMDEAEWSMWRDALGDLPRADGPARATPEVAIRLGAASVEVAIAPDYRDTFDAADRGGWHRLRTRAGRGSAVAVTLLADAAWAVGTGTGTGTGTTGDAPLPADRVIRSSPGADGAAGRSMVRKDWLERNIATITRTLSPASLSVADTAGRAFAVPLARRRRPRMALVTTGLVGLTALALAGFVWRDRSGRASAPAVVDAGARRSPIVPEPRSPALARKPSGPSVQPAEAADSFTLVGVVGRLPSDAVALVRPAWGRTVTLRTGDSLLGWRLVAIASDRVTLAKGGERKDLVLKPSP